MLQPLNLKSIWPDLRFEPQRSEKIKSQSKNTNSSVSQGKIVERKIPIIWQQQQHETTTTEEKMKNLEEEKRSQILRKKEQP